MGKVTKYYFFNEEEDKEVGHIIKDHEYIIKIIMSKYRIPKSEYEDVMQEGRLGLLKAYHSFKENMGNTFPSFASLCVERNILSYLRNSNRKKNKIHSSAYSLDSDQLEYKYNKSYRIEEEVIQSIYFNNAFKKAEKNINLKEYNLFMHYSQGYSISELCEIYQLEKKHIYMIIAKVKRKINEILDES